MTWILPRKRNVCFFFSAAPWTTAQKSLFNPAYLCRLLVGTQRAWSDQQWQKYLFLNRENPWAGPEWLVGKIKNNDIVHVLGLVYNYCAKVVNLNCALSPLAARCCCSLGGSRPCLSVTLMLTFLPANMSTSTFIITASTLVFWPVLYTALKVLLDLCWWLVITRFCFNSETILWCPMAA